MGCYNKSRLFGIGMDENEPKEQPKVLGCLKGSFPFTYMVVSAGANMSLKRIGDQ